MSDAAELVPVFSRREDLLSHLLWGTRTKAELVSRVDVSRSTVDRVVRRLESEGIVERRQGGYGFTLPGRLLFFEYLRFAASARNITGAMDLLSHLPPDAEFRSAVLAGAEIVEAGPATPFRPIEAHFEYVNRADTVRTLATAVGPQYVDVFYERIVDGELTLDVGCTPDVSRRLVAEYPEALEEALATGRMDLRELASTPPFSLAVFEWDGSRAMDLIVYGDGGARGLVYNDAEGAVEWAETVFDDYWRDASNLSPATGASAETQESDTAPESHE